MEGEVPTHRHAGAVSSRRLLATIALNFAITAAEVVGGVLSGSLSLLSDATHNFADGFSVIVTFLALRLAKRKNSLRHTFGLKRAEILAAAFNAAVLLAITIYLFEGAVRRLVHPVAVDGRVMTAVALLALVTNAAATLLLRAGAAHSLNVRSAYLHLLADAVASLGVVLGGLAITHWRASWVDPVLTVLIGFYVLRAGFGILSEAVHVLMEGAPPGLDLQALRDAVEALPEVEDLHHLHVWTVGERDVHLDAHINVQDMRVSEGDALRRAIETLLRASFGINHPTIQLECAQCRDVGLIKP
jgi:cobalt-zinc-cadmium efflux system protein